MGKRLLFVGNGVDLLTGYKTRYNDFLNQYMEKIDYLIGRKLKDAKKIRFLNVNEDYDEVKKEFEKINIKYFEEAKSLYFYPPYEIFNLHKKNGEIWYYRFGCIYWDVISSEVIDKKYEFLYGLLENCKEGNENRAVINGCVNNEFHKKDILMKEINFTYRQEGEKSKDLYEANKRCYELAYKEEKKIELNIFILAFILVNREVIGVEKYTDNRVESWGDLEFFIKKMAEDDTILKEISKEFNIPYEIRNDKSFNELKQELASFIEKEDKNESKFKIKAFEESEHLLKAEKIINFNYKGNALIEEANHSEDILYVHGKYEHKDKIILGFDESANKSMIKGESNYRTDMIHMAKVFQYGLKHDEDKRKAREIMKKHWDSVAVFGHSISESDYSYFFNILDKNLEEPDFKFELIHYAFDEYSERNNKYNLYKSFVKMLRAYEIHTGKRCMEKLYDGALYEEIEFKYNKEQRLF